jgi:uncharacterized protein (DUF983 family)
MDATHDNPPATGGFQLDHIHGGEGERDLRQAIWRGWRRRCPACGTGPMMNGFLKVRDTCTVCGEELHHHRADDGPAYLTILVVGHLMAPLLGAAFMIYRPDPMVLSAVFAIGTVAASLWLLPRFKGLMVGFQWAKRMHGFAPDLADDAHNPA